jgi:ribonuclease HI
MIEIYTDGACRGNPGPGGWAAVIVRNGATEEIGGHEAHTTNQRMELRAALEALRHVPAAEPVTLYSDSQYLQNGMTGWVSGWKKRGWLTAEKQPVKHRDLWEELDRLAGTRVTWRWVRGHAGNERNERADIVAQAYADDRPPPSAGTSAAAGRPPGTSYLSFVHGVLQRHASWIECEARVKGVSGARFKKCATAADEQATVAAWGLPSDAVEKL